MDFQQIAKVTYSVLSLGLQVLIVALLVLVLAVFWIYGQTAEGRSVKISNGTRFCSGVIVETNLVLTAAHCSHGNDKFEINGNPATLVKIDKDKDLALLKTPTRKVRKLRFAYPEQRDEIEIFGFPFNSDNLVYSDGKVMVVQHGFIFTNALLMAGGSGSGLWRRNKLAGICTSTMKFSDGAVSRVVPAGAVKHFLMEVR